MDPATLTTRSTAVPHNLKLSAQQEELLYAALNSNNKPTTNSNPKAQSANQYSMAPSALTDTPVAPDLSTLNGFEESPFVDYDYDFDPEGSFDYGFGNDSQGQMIGNLPGTSSDGDADAHDKRSHPDDDEDDDEGGGKRREGEGKTSKKPGRKPLTSEPTSKRKAQNRAAQRAFRERKEKHLKDLETKVDDLEKASESANHENSILRSQIEKMSTELQEYKKRFSATNGLGRSTSLNNDAPSYLTGKALGGNGGANNPSDVNFSFEFPRFGRLPGPPQPSLTTLSSPSDYSSPILGQNQNPSPRNQSLQSPGGSIIGNGLTQTPTQMGGDMSSLSGLFSPSLLESVSKSPQYDFFGSNSNNTNGSRSSSDSISNNNTSYSSPSASSNGHPGAPSSCGTSPEPTTQSPHYNKAADMTLTTIGEEKTGEGELTFCDKLNMACGNPNQPIPRTMSKSEAGNIHTIQSLQNQTFDFNGIDWFAQQNGNQFDPQLFGDYREPQENVLANEAITDSFFSDAFSMPDFSSPYNIAPSPAPPKKDLLSQLDQKQDEEEEVVPAEDRSTLLSCNTIWDRLQACPKVKDGEFDLDLLCKDLQKKAKCSETGAVVNESDFNSVLQTYVDGKGRKA